MLNLETKTKYPPEKAASRVKAFFGDGGLGLQLTCDTPNSLSFEGGGGYVTVTICPEEKKTLLTFETREWEIQVKKVTRYLQ